MKDNDIPQCGRTLFTFEEEKSAREWIEKALALEEKYKNELTEAGYDEDKKRDIIKRIYDEVGPVPMPIKNTLQAALPIVIEITKYQKESEQNTANDQNNIWICPCCKSNSTGKFCIECGSVKPK